MSSVSRLVKKTPGPLRRLFYSLVPFRYRYGDGLYRRTLDLINESQWWDYDELKSYQLYQLNRLLHHAYDNTPYYKRVFDERGIKPDDIQSIQDLKKLPILTKDIAREQDLLTRPTSGLIKFSTSGSTGDVFSFWGSDDLYKREAAFITRAFSAHGVRLYDEKTVWIRRYVPSEGDPLFKYDYELNRLYLSAYHLSLDTIRQYVDIIDSYGARVLVGYPSSLYIFSTLLEESGIRPANIEVAHSSSEHVINGFKLRTEEILGVPMKSHYGMVERVSMFFQCDHSDHYHESMEYGVTEFVDGVVVGTGFLNYSMPLIRYRMDDMVVENKSNKQCGCGRGLPLSAKDFIGRSNDMLITKDGRPVPGVNFYSFMCKIPGVRMFQVIQNSVDDVVVRVVPNSLFDKGSERLIVRKFMERLDIIVKIELVRTIERDSQTGKIKCLINNTRS